MTLFNTETDAKSWSTLRLQMNWRSEKYWGKVLDSSVPQLVLHIDWNHISHSVSYYRLFLGKCQSSRMLSSHISGKMICRVYLVRGRFGEGAAAWLHPLPLIPFRQHHGRRVACWIGSRSSWIAKFSKLTSSLCPIFVDG